MALLSGARVVKCTREIMETGTHTDEVRSGLRYQDRVKALEEWSGYADDPHRQRFIYQRWLVGRLIPRIFNELKVKFWAGHNVGFRPTSIYSIRGDIGDSDEGLVDILTKDTGYSSGDLTTDSSALEEFAKYVGFSANDLTANSSALEAALKSMRGEVSEGINIADQYMKHFQDKSVQDFAVSVVRSKIGTVDSKVVSSLAKKLRVGRTDSIRAGLQDVINVHSLLIEPICRKLQLPLRGGVVCGIAWNPANSPAQMSVSTGESIILVPESILMLCHFMSKLLALTLSVKVEGERLAIDCDCENVLRKMQLDEQLRNYAAGGLAYCTTWNLRLICSVGQKMSSRPAKKWSLPPSLILHWRLGYLTFGESATIREKRRRCEVANEISEISWRESGP